MEISLLDQSLDQYSVVVEFDAMDNQEETTNGTLAYEVEAENAGAATMKALLRVAQTLRTNWRATANLYNVRVSAVLLTDAVRQAIALNMEAEKIAHGVTGPTAFTEGD